MGERVEGVFSIWIGVTKHAESNGDARAKGGRFYQKLIM